MSYKHTTQIVHLTKHQGHPRAGGAHADLDRGVGRVEEYVRGGREEGVEGWEGRRKECVTGRES